MKSVRARQLITLLAFLGMTTHDANALSVNLGGGQLDVTWTVDFNPANNCVVAGVGCFQYRYTIDNIGAVPLNNLRWTVGGGHFPVHDEVNQLQLPIYAQDTKVPFPHPNYDWQPFDLAIGGTIDFGFDDFHGPAIGTGELERVGLVPELPDFAFVPVPGFPQLTVNNGVFIGGIPQREYTMMGSAVEEVIPGNPGLYQYKYFLLNTGLQAIDPTVGNHADFFLNDIISHHPLHDEVANLDQAALFGTDGTHGAEPLPFGVSLFNEHWFDLANPAWQPGTMLTLGFLDAHPPGRTSTGGRIVGSNGEAFSTSQSPVPDLNGTLFVPEPSTFALLSIGVLSAFYRRNIGVRVKLNN